MIKVAPLGRFVQRQPFAYGALQDLFVDDFRIVANGDDADVIVLAHSKDLFEMASDLIGWSTHKKIVLLSEEPFWDTIWAPDPFARDQIVETDSGPLPFTYLNHVTSDVFAFDLIPYFLLTDYKFPTRYAQRFDRNAQWTATDWQAHFAQAQYQAAFVAEKRLGERYGVRFEQHDTYGLCRFRSQLTQDYQTGDVFRTGLGWGKGARRQNLRDWHLDKLLELDRKCRFVSGLENTHQPRYLTEKLFDAFAVGGVPLYYASPQHSIHGLGLEGAWLNLFGMTLQQGIKAINGFVFDADFFAAYTEAQQTLANIFNDPSHLWRARQRFKTALLAEFSAVLNG